MSHPTVTLYVSDHSISRWRERAIEMPDDGTVPERETDDQIRARIGHALLNSRRVRLKNPSERISKSVSHGSLATYHHHGKVVLVVADQAVVSVYMYDRSRWESA